MQIFVFSQVVSVHVKIIEGINSTSNAKLAYLMEILIRMLSERNLTKIANLKPIFKGRYFNSLYTSYVHGSPFSLLELSHFSKEE